MDVRSLATRANALFACTLSAKAPTPDPASWTKTVQPPPRKPAVPVASFGDISKVLMLGHIIKKETDTSLHNGCCSAH